MISIVVIAIVFFALFKLQNNIYRRLWSKGLDVDVRFEDGELFEGDESNLLEVIKNDKRLPLTMINVKFQTDRNLLFDNEAGSSTTDMFYRNDIFQINGYEKITRRLPFKAKKRGYYKVNNIDLVGNDILLSEHFYASLDVNTWTYVYPRPLINDEMKLSLQQLNGEILSKRHILEDPFEYRGIREYQPYDDMRMINWKATAKTGEFKVNQKNETSLREIRIFINVEDTGILKKDDCVESCFRIAAGLCKVLTDQGMRISIYCNNLDIVSSKPMMIESNVGKVHLGNIYKSLARLDTQKEAGNFVSLLSDKVFKNDKGLLTIFISPNHYTDFVELIEKYKASKGRFMWYYPVSDKTNPELPADLMAFTKFIHI